VNAAGKRTPRDGQNPILKVMLKDAIRKAGRVAKENSRFVKEMNRHPRWRKNLSNKDCTEDSNKHPVTIPREREREKEREKR